MLLSLPCERLALALPRQENGHSGTCRITHGPHDSYFENIVGKSVASVRRGLATVFSISTDAEAFIGGQSMASIGSGRANDWFIRELAGVESIGAGVSSSAARALGSRKASRHRK